MRQFVYKWFVLLFSLGGFDFLVDGGNLFANQVQFVFQLLHLLVHFVEEAAALLRTASQEAQVVLVRLDFAAFALVSPYQAFPFAGQALSAFFGIVLQVVLEVVQTAACG